MTDIVIRRPETATAEAEANGLVVKAQCFAVETQEEHAAGAAFLTKIAGIKRFAVELFADAKKAANDAHKSICAAEKKLVDPCDSARALISGKLFTYEAEARRKAEEERRRLEEQARRDEEARKLADAIDAEESGDAETAEEILNEPVVAPVVTVAPAIAKVAGVSARTTWAAEVVDKAALIRYVAEHPEWIGLLDANMPSLNGLARSQRDRLAISGVKASEKHDYAVRS